MYLDKAGVENHKSPAITRGAFVVETVRPYLLVAVPAALLAPLPAAPATRNKGASEHGAQQGQNCKTVEHFH